ncbi:MAG: peptidoglycan-associated lipoprotein [Thiobacillus sp. SCN 63-374]|nr:MAG: peptidoglycan-associated lipoprotein [Thiobacillus sp. SCN 63-374]
MNKIFWPVLLALTLSACGTTGGTQATVEDRTGGTAASAGQAAGAGKTAGTETTALGGAGVAGSALDGSYAGDPRKNPASPLSTRSIFFDFDSFVVKAEYRPVLEAHAGYLLSKRDARAILQGNADERGSRAQLEAVSFGEEKPRNEASTEEAYAENRRTDVVYADE